MEPEEGLLKFPCSIAVKAIGKQENNFEDLVRSIILRHVMISEEAVTRRSSREGKYVTVTAMIYAESRQQLEAIYLDLSQQKQVLMTL